MTTEGTKYELMFILSPMLTEDKRKKVMGEIDALLKDKEADVFETDDWGKRELAYRIKRYNEGYYMVYYFVLPNRSDLHELDEHLRLDQDVLRHLIIKRDDDHKIHDFQKLEEEAKKEQEERRAAKAARKSPRKNPKPKKENKVEKPAEVKETDKAELNKKLDKIVSDDDLDV